jgi:hypothetical protein
MNFLADEAAPGLSSERCARRAMMWLRLPKSREARKGTRAAPPVLRALIYHAPSAYALG